MHGFAETITNGTGMWRVVLRVTCKVTKSFVVM